MSDVVIRDATERDIAAVRALTAQWDAPDSDPPRANRGEIEARDILAPGGARETLVAEREGAAVGFLLHARAYDLWSRTRGANLLEVYVDERARRGGVGRALLAELAHRTLAGGGRWAPPPGVRAIPVHLKATRIALTPKGTDPRSTGGGSSVQPGTWRTSPSARRGSDPATAVTRGR